MLKLKLQAVSIGIGALLLAVLLAWFGYNTTTRIGEVEYLWRDYKDNDAAVAKALHQFTADFGVGSFIHGFKTYMLTQDESLTPQIDQSITDTYQALDEYLLLEISDQEQKVLYGLRHSVDIYVAKYHFARELLAQGMAPKEVEEQVQVNDMPARSAMKFLSDVAKLRRKTKEVQTQMVLGDTVKKINWASALIFLVFLVAAVMIRFLYNSWRANQRVNEISGQLRGIVEAAPDAMLSVNSKGQILQCNAQAAHIFGCSKEELLLMKLEQLVPQDYRQAHSKLRHRYFERPRLRLMGEGLELRAVRTNGDEFPVEISLNHTVLHDEKIVIATVRDVTERRQTELKMRQAATVFDNTDEAIVFSDPLRRVVNVNKAFVKMTGYSTEEACGRGDMFYLVEDNDFLQQQQLVSLEKFGQWRGELEVHRSNGEVYPVWHSVSVVKNEDGAITSYISLFSDISVIKQTEQWLTHLAHHDSLTGLPNRTLFSSSLGRAIAHSKRVGSRFALLFLDLDRFKIINDTLGHACGDQLLNEVGERLLQCIRGDDVVARLGGDEFTVILTNISHSEDAALVAEKIIATVSEPLDIDGRQVVTSTSVGISVYPDDASDADGLAKAADAAMYKAKEQGRNNFQFYSAEMTRKVTERLAIEQGLRDAMSCNALHLVYQPQVDLKSRQVIGVEALVRWEHPELGTLSPTRFIPIAEETGLIQQLGEWVLYSACAQLRVWNAMGFTLRMAVNVSVRQLGDDASLNRLVSTLEQLELHKDKLKLDLEITESTLEMAERSVSVLRSLKQQGVGLAIDDFGTGYSSLSRLKQLPIDTLKIDRSFVKDIPHDADDNAIASAVIAMGHSLNLKIVGEGVESQEQMRFLQQQGCDYAQGYLFSQPISADAVTRLLRNEGPEEVVA
ncbi:MAG: EAL domain-containing protein [Gammaproteobacteria bacterium]|nr:EAL domain-containing protein [Gammaproteobacteria bacterium]MDH5803448.1 EAL domain-containing protein [Gammaproteobacteria bacterium]